MTVDTTFRMRAALPLIHALEPSSAAAVCGVVAGAVYLPVRMLFAELLTPHGLLAPFQRIAAVLMGPDALPPAHAGFVAVSMALLVHLSLSLTLGQVIAHVVHRLRAHIAVLVGIAAGLGLFVVNYLVIAPLLLPWFSDGAHVGTALAHMVFGGVAAGVYTLLRKPAA